MAITLQRFVFLSAALFVVGIKGQDQLDKVREIFFSLTAARWAKKIGQFLAQIEKIGPEQLGLSPTCSEDFMTFLSEVVKPNATQWALLMVDSWGMQEAGFLGGNTNWEGRTSQCKQARSGVIASTGKEITGRYCNLGWFMYDVPSLPTGIGVCIPSSCTKDDVFQIVQALVYGQIIGFPPVFPFGRKNATYTHCTEIPDIRQDKGAIAAAVILSLLAVIGVLASLYDIFTKKPRSTSDPSRDTPRHDSTVGGGTATSSVENNQGNVQLVSLSHISCEMASGDAPPKESSANSYNLTKDVEIATSNMAEAQTPRNETKPSVVRSVILCFSAYRNMQNTARCEHVTGSYRCLNAIRFLSMSWIILGHTWQLGLILTERNIADNVMVLIADFMKRISFEAINKMSIAVESFFVISAMLTTISFLKKLKNRKGHPCAIISYYYFHRYWRLTPVYMLILMFYATMFSYLGTGPNYPVPSLDSYRCRSDWWKNLIYLNNLIGPDKLCMGWSWYLACDFQFYVMAPMFVALLYWKPTAGIVMTSLGLCGSLIANIVLYTRKDTAHFTEIYLAPWTRSGSYFVGILLGYILSRRVSGSSLRNNVKSNRQKTLAAVGWLISLSAITVIIYINHITNQSPAGWKIFYLTVDRPVFAVAVSWIIYACCTGYGGIINSILSWVGWVPLAKLTYTGYLIHPIFVYYTYYSSTLQVYISMWNMVYYFLGNLMLTLGTSFIVTSFLELPFLRMERVMFRNVKL